MTEEQLAALQQWLGDTANVINAQSEAINVQTAALKQIGAAFKMQNDALALLLKGVTDLAESLGEVATAEIAKAENATR